MKITLNINDEVFKKASKLTGIKEKTELIILGIKSLITKESARQQERLGGTQKHLQNIPHGKT